MRKGCLVRFRIHSLRRSGAIVTALNRMEIITTTWTTVTAATEDTATATVRIIVTVAITIKQHHATTIHSGDGDGIRRSTTQALLCC